PVTDRAPAPVADAPPGEAESGIGHERALIYNCDPDQHRFHYWIGDMTAGSTDTEGPVDAMYSETGFCPDPAGEPYELELDDGHQYQVVAVDPEAVGCEGRNDPSIVACAKHAFALAGAANGRTARIILQAGPILQTLALRLSAADILLQRLEASGLDYSVPPADMHAWLNNAHSR